MRERSTLFLVLLLQILGIVSSLRVCTRRHYKVHSTAILHRVELISAEKCVERCIENMEYCFIAQFVKSQNMTLGICTHHSETSDQLIHPDATLDPLTVIYQLLDKCPPFTASDITHRISKLHRDALQDGRVDGTNKARLADAFFPESRDHLGADDEFQLEGERYAVMRSIEKVEIEASKSRDELPRDPFNDGPRFHQSSHERDRGDDRDRQRDRSYFKENHKNREKPIHPIVSHNSQGNQAISAPFASGSITCGSSNCAHLAYQMDNAPCPARQGDPCAPKRPCERGGDCYPLSDGGGAQIPVPEWTEWTACSANCGASMKTRQCSGGISCIGPSSLPCPTIECATWTLWSPWSLCTASCGVGEKQRTRICQSGRNCPGPSIEIEACKSILPCPSWSSWTAWTGCTNTCGKGIERRSRICQNGILCPGPATEERTCDKGPCPHWSTWGPWDSCSKECGGGFTYRSRDCIDGHCEGASEEKLLCNQQPCPEWSQWTTWTVCDERCGEETIRLRNRKCLNAESNNMCEGPAQDQMSCPYRDCPKFEEWGEWTDCSTTCGQGTQKRTRACDTPNECRGPTEEMRFCQVASCPYWGDWAQWSGCSVTCGRGVCERTRKCITDEFLRLPTLEELERDDSLEKHEAKEALIARAKTISKYRRTNETRFSPLRVSSLEAPIGGTCDGPETETKVCDAGPCCSWDNWSDWSPCIGCGRDGVSKRNRVCSIDKESSGGLPSHGFQEDNRETYVTPPLSSSPLLAGLSPIIPYEVHRGKRQVLFGINARQQCHCPGDSFQTRLCPEPVPCQDPNPKCEWSEWGEWCGCTRCRGGKETRRRFCDRASAIRGGPSRPDASCDCGPGNDVQERNCPMRSSCFGLNDAKQNSRIDDQRAKGASYRHSSGPYHVQGGPRERDPAGVNSRNDEQYVPIDSVIGRVQLKGKDESYNKKDSPDSFVTTDFPYKVCHWSKWSEWSSCHENSIKERKRFCVGEEETELVSNCECIGRPHEEEHCNATGFIEQSEEETDKDIERSLDKLLGSTEVDDTEEPKSKVISSLNSVQCQWTRWSQWSVCTVSCGDGKRMRRRRCPCGETDCGPGSDSDSEPCQNQPCDIGLANERKKPIFTVLPSSPNSQN